MKRTLKVKFAFQLRIKPGSYRIGQETVGATRNGNILDDNFRNEEIEWYTKQNMGIVLYGLLLNINMDYDADSFDSFNYWLYKLCVRVCLDIATFT